MTPATKPSAPLDRGKVANEAAADEALTLLRDRGVHSADAAEAALLRLQAPGLLPVDMGLLLEVLRAHSTNSTVQEIGLATLVGMCQDPSRGAEEQRSKAVEGGAVRLAASALLAHSTEAGVVKQACAALFGIPDDMHAAPTDRVQRGIDLGNTELLVAALRENLTNGAAVCGVVCRALECTIFRRDDDASKGRAQLAFRAGAIDAAVAALRMCLAEPDAYVSAILSCMSAICSVMDGAPGSASRAAAVEAGAIELVGEAMKSRHNSAPRHLGCIRHLGTYFYDTICLDTNAAVTTHMQRCVDAGMLEALIGAVSQGLSAAQEEAALNIVRAAAACCPTSAPQRATEAGIFEALAAGLEARPLAPNILECSFDIIKHLCCSSFGAAAWQRLSQTTATSAVVSVMRACPTDANALNWGCHAIAFMIGDILVDASDRQTLEVLRQCAFDAGAVEVVMAGMCAFPTDSDLVGLCCSVVSLVAAVGPTTMDKAPGRARLQRVVGVGAIELSVTALLTHPTSERVLCGASRLLTKLSYYPLDASDDAALEAAQQHVDRAVKAGVVQAIVAAMRARPASTVLVAAITSGVRALRDIMFTDTAHKQLVANLGAVDVVLSAMNKPTGRTQGCRHLAWTSCRASAQEPTVMPPRSVASAPWTRVRLPRSLPPRRHTHATMACRQLQGMPRQP